MLQYGKRHPPLANPNWVCLVILCFPNEFRRRCRFTLFLQSWRFRLPSARTPASPPPSPTKLASLVKNHFSAQTWHSRHLTSNLLWGGPPGPRGTPWFRSSRTSNRNQKLATEL